MEELIILKYEADNIENTLRIISNEFESHKRETCLDRMIDDSIKQIQKVLQTSADLK